MLDWIRVNVRRVEPGDMIRLLDRGGGCPAGLAPILDDGRPVALAVASVVDVHISSDVEVAVATLPMHALRDPDLHRRLQDRGIAVHHEGDLVRLCDAVGIGIGPLAPSADFTRLAATQLDLGKYHWRYGGHGIPRSDIDEMEMGRDPARAEAASLPGLMKRYGMIFGDPSIRPIPLDARTDLLAAHEAATYEACATALVAPHLVRDLERDGLMPTYRKVQIPGAIALSAVARGGVRLDLPRVEKTVRGCMSVEQMLGPRLAAAGLRKPLDDTLIVPALRRTGVLGPRPLAVEKGMERLRLRDLGLMVDQHEILAKLYRFRVAYHHGHGVLSQCLQLADEDGFVYPKVDPLGTETGRPAFSSPNLPGLARSFRPVVVPDRPGLGIVEFDFVAEEPGIAGWLYRDERLIADWHAGDVYLNLARRLLGPVLGIDLGGLSDAEVVGRFPKLRVQAKVLLLAIIYGMDYRTVAERLGVSAALGRRLVETFGKTYPGLAAGIGRQWLLLARDGWVASVSGLKRHRPVTGPLASFERRWAVNAPVQASGADVLKVVLPPVASYLRGVGGRVLLPPYDSLVVQLPLPLDPGHVSGVVELMQAGFQSLFPGLRPRVSVNRSRPHCWNDDGRADSIDQFLRDALGEEL